MKIPIAIIGAGYLGTLHAKKIAESESAEISYIVDTNFEKAQSLAWQYGCKAFSSLSQAIEHHERKDIQAAIIASSTETHFENAQLLLSKQFHLLIEKPCTSRANLAKTLVAQAHDLNLHIRIGYLESFSPLILPLKQQCQQESSVPYYITTERLGPFSGRSTDIDVVKDLMVHDLYHILSFGLQNVTDLRSIGIPVITSGIDIANVRIEFAHGAVVNLTASRVSLESSRKLRIFTSQGYYSLDLKTQAMKHIVREVQDNRSFPFSVDIREHSDVDLLKTQDQYFINELMQGNFAKYKEITQHQQYALQVLELAETITQKMKIHQTSQSLPS